jgi:hypothetical protein
MSINQKIREHLGEAEWFCVNPFLIKEKRSYGCVERTVLINK